MIEVNVISMLILLAAIKAASMLKRATMEATVVAAMSLVILISTAMFLTRINSYILGNIEFASCNSQLQETFLGAGSSATKRGSEVSRFAYKGHVLWPRDCRFKTQKVTNHMPFRCTA